MGVRIISEGDLSALYCSTEMVAFGPVFDEADAAEDFLNWLPMDARTYSQSGLREMHNRWYDLAHDTEGNFIGHEATEPPA